MSKHLSEKGISMYLVGDVNLKDRRHAEECPACQARIANLVTSLSHFRGAIHSWSGRASAVEQPETHWMVLAGTDHLERLLPPASLTVPWYRSLWHGLIDCVTPQAPVPDVTSKPVLVKDIWGQYGRQKKSWAMSLALQCAAVLLLFTVASSRTVQQRVGRIIPLLNAPVELPKMPHARDSAGGGGGGGDRSPMQASKGRLPKAALRQFTPPAALPQNSDPKLSMIPSIVAPPEIAVPEVNMGQYGDPLAKIGIPSNGTGSGSGIGSGVGGGVGSGAGGGFGPGSGGGSGSGVFRVGGGVTAPVLVSKVEPEYSDEARKAKYQGVVVLYVEVDTSGRAQNIRVLHSLGLGLDEKAVEAVRRWRFRPGYKDGKPVVVAATIEVNFRLL